MNQFWTTSIEYQIIAPTIDINEHSNNIFKSTLVVSRSNVFSFNGLVMLSSTLIIWAAYYLRVSSEIRLPDDTGLFHKTWHRIDWVIIMVLKSSLWMHVKRFATYFSNLPPITSLIKHGPCIQNLTFNRSVSYNCMGGGGILCTNVNTACAADLSWVFSNFGTFMGRKFTYFRRILAIWYVGGLQIAHVCRIPAILVYWWVENSRIFAKTRTWSGMGPIWKSPAAHPYPNFSMSKAPSRGGGGG